MSSESRQALQRATPRYVVPRLRSAIIGDVPYLLIDDYMEASVASRTHDYRDRVYYNAT
jgi:hypothetical protein